MDDPNIELEFEPNILTESENRAEYGKAEGKDLESKCIENTSNTNENLNLTDDRSNNSDIINSQHKVNLNKFHVKNQVSKDHWKTVEELVAVLQKENERLTNQLTQERQRSMNNQKKLQFIQDHQDVFQRLKDAYLNLKRNKTKVSPFIESNLTYPDHSSECITIQRKDLNAVKVTIDALKSHLTSGTDENKFRKDIADLYKKNMNLNDQIKEKESKIEALKMQLNTKKTQNGVLRKIIAKLLKKLSQNRNIKNSVETLLTVNETEQKIIDLIATKYIKNQFDTENEKNIESPKSSKSVVSVSMSIDEKCPTPFYTPRALESP